MCAHPFDYAGPVSTGASCGQACRLDQRAGSALGGVVQPPQEAEMSYSFDDIPENQIISVTDEKVDPTQPVGEAFVGDGEDRSSRGKARVPRAVRRR